METLELWDVLFLVLKVLLQEIKNHLPYSDAAWTVGNIYLHVPLNVDMFHLIYVDNPYSQSIWDIPMQFFV